jgi:hypothetical protein
VELAEDFLHDYELVGFQTTVEQEKRWQ